MVPIPCDTRDSAILDGSKMVPLNATDRKHVDRFMPTMPPKQCARCSRPVRAARYCDPCKKQIDREYEQKRRFDPTRAFYNSTAWRNFAAMIKARDPVCKMCRREPTEHIDHITPIKHGGEKLDPENVQGLCQSCHSKKSTAEGSRWKRQVKNI